MYDDHAELLSLDREIGLERLVIGEEEIRALIL